MFDRFFSILTSDRSPGQKRISQERFEQLQGTGADKVVMACPFCSIMLKGAQASANAPVEMVDLMTYVDGQLKKIESHSASEKDAPDTHE